MDSMDTLRVLRKKGKG